jgi:hypothetical protein
VVIDKDLEHPFDGLGVVRGEVEGCDERRCSADVVFLGGREVGGAKGLVCDCISLLGGGECLGRSRGGCLDLPKGDRLYLVGKRV